MASVGFTTGCLYRSNIAFDERIKLYSSFGADTIELGFATPNQLFEFQLTEDSIRDLKKYETVSIHAPWKEIRYDSSSNTENIIDKLKFLYDELSISGLVLHPDTIDNFEILEQSGLPFLLENMDRRKSSGTRPEHFEELKSNYNFDFILDVQHAYEQDPTMKLANELIDVMGDRLKHMHISGFTESMTHVPTILANNKDAITEVLKLGINVPKILEGVLLENIETLMKAELSYVRSFEK